MTDTEAQILLALWLALVAVLALSFALAVLRAVLYDTPGAQLEVREALVPLWCLLAGREQRNRLREILETRETASGTLRDVAEYRARHLVISGQCRKCGHLLDYPEKQLLDLERMPCGHPWPDLSLSRFIDILGL